MSGTRRACSTRLQDLLEEEGRKEKKGNKRNEKRKKKKKPFTYAPDTGLVLQYVACLTAHSSSIR